MSEMFYAQDATDIGAAQRFWEAQMQAAPDGHWMAFVDGAFDYGQSKRLAQWGGITCYASQDLAGLQSVSPLLIELANDKVGHQRLRRLLEHCSARPMLSIIHSTVPAAQLAQLWQQCHWITTGDGQRLLLRFADSRVLPVLPGVLRPEHCAKLSNPIKAWFYIARDGRVAPCLLAPPAIPPSTAMEIDTTQLEKLLDAAEPDILLDFFAEHLPDTLPTDINRSVLYNSAFTIINLARTYQVGAWADIVSLMLSEWQTQGKFQENPEITALLQAGNWIPGKLGENISEIL